MGARRPPKLPRLRQVDAEWRLGVPATALDRANRLVRLADGSEVTGDRLLIATGVRARRWPNAQEAALEGVHPCAPAPTPRGCRRLWSPVPVGF